MTERDTSSELVSLRVLREQRWVYEHRMQRRTWHDIVKMTAWPVDKGGLGYPLGVGTLRALHRTYIAEALEAEERTRDEHVHNAVLELDHMQRLVEGAFADYTERKRQHGEPVSVSTVITVTSQVLRIHESRRRLLGLDAPTKVDATVTVERDLDAELAALQGVGIPTHHERQTP